MAADKTSSGPERRRAVAIGHDGRAATGGRGAMADALLTLARERGIPVRQDADLAEVLSAIDPADATSDAATALTAAALDRLYRLNDAAKAARRQDK